MVVNSNAIVTDVLTFLIKASGDDCIFLPISPLLGKRSTYLLQILRASHMFSIIL